MKIPNNNIVCYLLNAIGTSDHLIEYFMVGTPSESMRIVCSSLPTANWSLGRSVTNGSFCFPPVGKRSFGSPLS